MAKEKEATSTSSKFNVANVLGLIFIVLKLVGTIDWSWWWVLAPFWGLFIIGLIKGTADEIKKG